MGIGREWTIHDVGAHLNSREHDVSQSFFQLSLVDSDIIS